MNFCLKCTITPLDTTASAVTLSQDNIQLSQAVYCSDALVAKTVSIPAFNYVNNADKAEKISGYSVFFTHAKVDCLVKSCWLKGKGCETTSYSKISFDSTDPYPVKANTNVDNGYVSEFCYEC